ncbi:BatA domain-containing protein [Pseudomarimonas arenosa]|uniref:BatA domain-containing protein n=1 Tax=Pseudomarimonas arenosa TaxID=2774145 RepID=A0AAW3ZM37_9GAMM|nr:BatA domain-containing protein [Pseudomarimonas arenosa]MBD8525366.1 BatA domain-containing protein [Pseudomarimonas arenosa]
MSLGLLWPIALTGLVGLLLPVLIHRLPRRKSSPRSFAALRFVGHHQPPRQQRKISEWPLLILRLLLLSLLLLWLAAPQWLNWQGRGLQWRAVWPGVAASAAMALPAADRNLWLAPGYPELSTEAIPSAPDQTASLLRQLAADLPAADRLTVLVPEQLSGLDATSLGLARAVQWQVVQSVATDGPTLKVRKLSLRVEQAASPSQWLEAALQAWADDPALATTIDRGDAEASVPADADAVLWLGDHPAPRFAQQRVPLLQVPAGATPSTARERPWTALPQGDARLHGPLRPDSMPEVLEADFPQQLHQWLFRRHPQPQQAPAASVVPTVEPKLEAALRVPPLDLRPWVALLAALLLLAERWLANGRRLHGRAQ